MDQRTKLTLQILEKLGGPLMAAVGSAGVDDQAREAELVAGLLARSVKAGLSLSGSLKPKEADGEADSVRLALTGLSSGLVAGFYKQTGKVPGDNDINRIITAFQAVLTFADNFTPSADNALRLEGSDPGAFLADENQIYIQYLNVFVPVVNAVAAFSFGRQEKKLVQEIAGRLIETAASMRGSLLADAGEKQARRIELQLLKGLVGIYVQGHEAEMRRLMALGEKERAEAAHEGGILSMDPVWKSFETRAAMMEVLGKSLTPVAAGGSARSPAPEPKNIAPSQPMASANPQPPPVSEAPAATPPPAGYNPMAFFKPGAGQPGEETKGS